jgi:hypothetical protein
MFWEICMKKSLVVVLVLSFLFSMTYSVLADSCKDANAPRAVCPKAKGECPMKKAACDKKDAKHVCDKDKKCCEKGTKKGEDPNKAGGKK